MSRRGRRHRYDPYAKYRRGEFYFLSNSNEPYTRQQFVPLIKKLLNPPREIKQPQQVSHPIVAAVASIPTRRLPVMKMNISGSDIEVTGTISELVSVFVHLARNGV